MKLSFSTRGWLGLTWEKLIDIAKEMKFEGIEVYNLMTNTSLYEKGEAFHKYNMAASARKLKDMKLCIPCFDSSADLSGEESPNERIFKLIEKANAMNVPYVGVCALSDKEDLVKERLDVIILHTIKPIPH